jgi:hypothetical protein
MKFNFDDEKRNRIIAAFTVAAVLLVAILFVVLIYQIIEMITLSSIEKQLLDEYNNLVSGLVNSTPSGS